MSRLLVVAVSLIALVASGCSGSQVDVDDADAPAGSEVSTSSEVDEENPGPSLISLGEREAGFGPGSVVVAAADVVNRVESLVSSPASGDWVAAPPYSYTPWPVACGYGVPEGMQGISFSRQDPSDMPFGDSVDLEVYVYADAQIAADHVVVLNGPNAPACDAVSLADALEEAGGPDGTPGVNYDLGDGVGVETALPFDAETGAARRFEGTISIGSEERALEQVEWVVADGQYVVHVYATSTGGRASEIAVEVADLIFADPLPPVMPSDQLNTAINVARSVVLADDTLPSYYEEDQTLRVVTEIDTECFGAIDVQAIADGPTWLNITPGLGASQVSQSTLIFETADKAERAVTELQTLGADCFHESIGLPEPMFSLVDSSLTNGVVDGRDVTSIQIEYVQTINGADFDVEVGMSVSQVDEFIFAMRFVGLAGDSPNLAELAVGAADRSQR